MYKLQMHSMSMPLVVQEQDCHLNACARGCHNLLSVTQSNWPWWMLDSHHWCCEVKDSQHFRTVQCVYLSTRSNWDTTHPVFRLHSFEYTVKTIDETPCLLSGLVIRVPQFQHAVCMRYGWWNKFGARKMAVCLSVQARLYTDIPILHCPVHLVLNNYTQISVHPQRKGQRNQACICWDIHRKLFSKLQGLSERKWHLQRL